jgi:hypothetical protein
MCYSSLFKNCVGAVDGIAIEIQAPRSDDPAADRNQKRFFSWSELKYCFNMQAVCNSIRLASSILGDDLQACRFNQ